MNQPYSPYPGQQPPQQPTKRKKWPWILGGFVALVVLGSAIGTAGGGGGNQPSAGGSSTESTQQAPDKPAQVVYEVTGSGTASNISYGASGGVSQKTGASLPWKHTEPYDGGYDFFTLSAQNGNNDGEITCRITVDGEVVKENTSSGPYAVVSCSGNTGF